MSAGTVLLWRHGRTAHNATMRLQGQVDIPLDVVGERQARAAAAALVATTKPALIVVSDLGRAAATAGYLSELTGLEPVVEPRVRERSFGVWEGLTGEEISAGWATEYATWKSGGEPENVGAESRGEVAERMVEAITEHSAGLSKDEALVVVSHGAAITLAVTALLGLDIAGWRGIAGLTNAHWTELRRNPAGMEPAWRLFGHDLGPSTSIDDWNAGTDLA
ncbi:histidine phosphatase family protein [Pengzhenrongella frigida]|uniref:Histidine phosphatase family protein n=1 Tax=Pengzhenrongella frigida TaxID=1259133 RepID=A0A4Q5MX90_9MICO|nr:histidine phosphatase family protein [Cellulomonas sp. HLT2-17]RYV50230.1 histidine phosphatase family protein [Cellulomonas sp. HLT2-17]